MSAEENKAKVRAFFEQAISQGNLSAVDDLVGSPEIAHQSGTDVSQNTPQAVKEFVSGVRSAFPDAQATVELLLADGDKVVNLVTLRGTHTGAFTDPIMGRVAPTGKKVAYRWMSINRFAGGKSVEVWGISEDLAFWQQLGIISLPSPSGT
jgi:predicted ester cyclase